jgi:V-type H+-transporting ATPase subunit a
MFGDIGHGFSLLLFAVFIFLYSKSFPDNIARAKSLLLFMGIFGLFCGLIYNDFLSIPIPLAKSCYEGENF